MCCRRKNTKKTHPDGEQKTHNEVNGLIFLGFVNMFNGRWTPFGGLYNI